MTSSCGGQRLSWRSETEPVDMRSEADAAVEDKERLLKTGISVWLLWEQAHMGGDDEEDLKHPEGV